MTGQFYEAFQREMDKVTVMADAPAVAVVASSNRRISMDEAQLKAAERLASIWSLDGYHETAKTVLELVVEVARLNTLEQQLRIIIAASGPERLEAAEAQRDAWRQMAQDAHECVRSHDLWTDWVATFDRLVAEQEGTGASGPGRADRSAD